MLPTTLLLATALAGGNVCANADLEVDPFDNARKVVIHGHGYDITVDGPVAVLRFNFMEEGLSQRSLPKGAPFSFALANKATVKMFATAPAAARAETQYDQYGSYVATFWRGSFLLDATALHAVAQSPPLHMRITLERQHTFEFSDDTATRLQRDFACATMYLTEAP